MTRQRTRRFLLWCAVVLAASAMTACNSKPTTIRVGFIPIADCSQLFIAQDRGLFAANGVDVQTTSMAGGALILEAVGAGSLDIGFSNVVSLVLGHANQLPFVALTGGPAEDSSHQEHGIFVSTASSTTEIRQLAGKRIAINTRRNIDELMVSELLQSNGIDPKTVTFVEVPFPRMVTTLEGGDVDAIAVIEPFVTLAKDRNHRLLSSNYVAVQPTTEISTFVATRQWLADHRKEAWAFQRAIAAATEIANAHPDVVRAALRNHTSLDANQLVNIGLPLFTSELSEQLLQTMITRTQRAGWITSSFPARDVLSR